MKYKLLISLLLVALLFCVQPAYTGRSQTDNGYTCGHVEFVKFTHGQGWPTFKPYGFEDDANSKYWWPLNIMAQISVIETGEILNSYDLVGLYLRIWAPKFDQNMLSSVDKYEVVPSCVPDTAIPPTITPSMTFTFTPTFTDTPTYKPIPPTSTTTPTSTFTPLPTFTLAPTLTEVQATSIPVPSIPTPNNGQPFKDGYEPAPPALTIFDRIFQLFVPPAQASFSPEECQIKFVKNNCTWFVAGKRPDVCQWTEDGHRNAYQWIEQAQKNGSSLGIAVVSTPHVGDIAVWYPGANGCGGTSPFPSSGEPCTEANGYAGCGHVALVTGISQDGRGISISEYNWGDHILQFNTRTPDVLSCMSFITSPQTATPTPVTPPQPGIVPTPVGTPAQNFNIIDWFLGLFK